MTFNLELEKGMTEEYATESTDYRYMFETETGDKFVMSGNVTVGMIDGIPRFNIRRFIIDGYSYMPFFSRDFDMRDYYNNGASFYLDILKFLKSKTNKVEHGKIGKHKKLIKLFKTWLKEYKSEYKEEALLVFWMKEAKRLQEENLKLKHRGFFSRLFNI